MADKYEQYKKPKGVWVATLDRFGYTLMVAERTKKDALDAMSREYKKTYFNWNKHDGTVTADSVEEMVETDEEFKEYYRSAMGDINCNFMEYGKVEWC